MDAEAEALINSQHAMMKEVKHSDLFRRHQCPSLWVRPMASSYMNHLVTSPSLSQSKSGTGISPNQRWESQRQEEDRIAGTYLSPDSEYTAIANLNHYIFHADEKRLQFLRARQTDGI